MPKICVKTLTDVTFELDMQKDSSAMYRSIELSVDDVIEALPFPSSGCQLILRGDVVSNSTLLNQLDLSAKDFFVVIFDWKKFRDSSNHTSANPSVERAREAKRRQDMVLSQIFQRPANRLTSALSPDRPTSVPSSSGDEESSAKRQRRTQAATPTNNPSFLRDPQLLAHLIGARRSPSDGASAISRLTESSLFRSELPPVMQFATNRRRATSDLPDTASAAVDDADMADELGTTHSPWHSHPFIGRIMGGGTVSLTTAERADRVASVVAMGFSETASQRALQRSGYSVALACELLLQGLEGD